MAKLKLLFLFFFLCGVLGCEEETYGYGLVRKENRKVLAVGESGSISAVDVRYGARGAYHLQFITMEPGSLFLPVLLHSDMVFYVQSGRGNINFIEEEEREDKNKEKSGTKSFDVERGDIARLKQGATFYIRSYPVQTREKLRIYAIFNNIDNPSEQFFGAYSNISDIVRGFDERTLQMGFGVSEKIVQSIKYAERSPPIVPDIQRNETEEQEDKKANNFNWKEGIIESVVGVRDATDYLNKKKKSKDKDRTFNFYSGKPDIKNCYGWSTAVNNKDVKALKRSDIGAFMVNLTTGSMMGPHWNPRATEISIVTRGQGMIQIICPTNPSGQPETQFTCQNSLFRVKEGDLFIVPKYHPMAQVAFNNDSFVFVGFSTNSRKNYPQFLAGGRSVLNVIDRDVLARAFNVMNSSVVDELLSAQKESIIFECTSCAEDLVQRVEEEERRREEEVRAKEEEQRREKEEEEKAREEEQRRQQEEEERRRQQEEARAREEERKRQEEEERRRQEEEQERGEEERRREEEERRRQQEEEEARAREEERKRQEEEERRRREEEQERGEEERRQQEEEEARTREEQRRREQEEEQARAREERRQEEEEEETRRREEEEEQTGEEEEEGGEGEEWLQGRKLRRNKRFYYF